MQLTRDKETKNTFRFAGKDDGVDVTVYIQKSSPLAAQETLTITVK